MIDDTNPAMGARESMRYHRYNSFAIIGGRIFSFCLGLISNMLLVAVWAGWFVSSPKSLSLVDMIGITIGFLVFNVVMIMIANGNPDIAVNDDGLAVRFYFKWLFVVWEDVISFTRPVVSTQPKYLVRVKRLTVVHRLISFTQSGSIQPGFLISPSISDYTDLLHIIREHMGQS
jgi:hypothetical protein